MGVFDRQVLCRRTCATQVIDEFVARDRVCPWSERLRRVIGVSPRVNGDKSLRHQVLRLHRPAANAIKAIAEEGSKLEGHKNLTSIQGIGPLTGSILLSVIGDIHDCEDEGKLAAYFGIVPRVSKSNETEHLGRITKRGSQLGRTALVQCALIAQRYSPYRKQFYERIKAQKCAGKAIIALARKLLGIIYRTLKYNWVFEDFPNFVLAEATL